MLKFEEILHKVFDINDQILGKLFKNITFWVMLFLFLLFVFNKSLVVK
jgi:hypothetical protein